MELKEGSFLYKLEYDRQLKEMKLSSDNTDYSPINLSVKTNEEVSIARVEALSFLSAHGLDEKNKKDIANRINDLRFFTKADCTVLHLDIDKETESLSMTSLLGNIEKIKKWLDHGETSFHPRLITNFKGENSKNLELRAFFDKNYKFIKFFVSSKNENLLDLKISNDSNRLIVRSKSDKTLLKVMHGSKDINEGPFEVLYPHKNDLNLDLKRVFKFKDAELISSAPDLTPSFLLEDSVELTTLELEHRAVVRISGSDRYFSALKKDSVDDFLSIIELELTHYNLSQIEKEFNYCMVNEIGISTIYEKAFDDLRSYDICLSRSILINIPSVFKTRFDNNADISLDPKLLGMAFSECLSSKHVLKNTAERFELEKYEKSSIQAGISECRMSLFDSVIQQKIDDLTSKISNTTVNEFGLEKSLKFDLTKERNSCGEVIDFKELDACFDTLENKKDYLLAQVMISQSLVDDFSNESKDIVLKSFTKCEFLSKECVNRVFDSFIMNYPFERLPKTNSGVEAVRNRILNCVLNNSEDEQNHINSFEQLDFWFNKCKSEIDNEVKILSLKEERLSNISSFMEHFETEQKRIVVDEVKRIIDIENEVNVDTTNIQIYESLIKGHLSVIFSKLGLSLEKEGLLILNDIKAKFVGTGSADFFDLLRQQLVEVNAKSGEGGLKLFTRDLYKNIQIEIDELSFVSSFYQQSKDETLAKDKAKKIMSHVVECYDEFKANSSQSFSSIYIKCENEKMMRYFSLETNEKFRLMINKNFSKSTKEYQQVLEITSFFDTCLREVKGKGVSEVSQGCMLLSYLDIQKNISILKSNSFDYYGDYNLTCYSDAVVENLTSLSKDESHDFKNIFNLENTDNLGSGSLLKLLNNLRGKQLQGDSGNNMTLEKIILQLSKLDTVALERIYLKIDLCKEAAESTARKEFEDNILNSSYFFKSFTREQKVILGEFIDSEIIELFQKLTSQASTTSSGVDKIESFLKEYTILISEGLLFDNEQTKTEMALFRSDIKLFIKSMNQLSTPLSVDETTDFLIESNLSKELSKAYLSGIVKKQFIDYLKKEFADDTEMYNSQLAVLNKMLNSYEFNRILRPNSDKGEELLDFVNRYILLPKINNEEPSRHIVYQMTRKLNELIFMDNTNGGMIAEMVEPFFISYLDKHKAKNFLPWRVFEWEKLHKTKSGRAAMIYYSQNILLPKVSAQPRSQKMEKLDWSRVTKLLQKASKETDSVLRIPINLYFWKFMM